MTTAYFCQTKLLVPVLAYAQSYAGTLGFGRGRGRAPNYGPSQIDFDLMNAALSATAPGTSGIHTSDFTVVNRSANPATFHLEYVTIGTGARQVGSQSLTVAGNTTQALSFSDDVQITMTGGTFRMEAHCSNGRSECDFLTGETATCVTP